MFAIPDSVAEIVAAAEARWFRLSPSRFARFVERDVRLGGPVEAIAAATIYFKVPTERQAAIKAIEELAARSAETLSPSPETVPAPMRRIFHWALSPQGRRPSPLSD